MEQLRHTSPEERQYHLRELQEAHKQEVEEMKLRLLCLVEELDSQHEVTRGSGSGLQFPPHACRHAHDYNCPLHFV